MKHASRPNQLQVKMRQIREAARLSQETMAESLDISQSAYRKIESGKTEMKIKHLSAFAECVGLNVEDMVSLPLFDLLETKQ